MSELRIEQYSGEALGYKGFMQMPALPMVAQAITLTSSAVSSVSAALNANTRAIRVRCTGTPAVAFRLGDSATTDPVAVATDSGLADGEVAWFGIEPGLAGKSTLKIAVIDR